MASERVQVTEGIEIEAMARSRMALPPWFAEAVVMAKTWTETGLLAKVQASVRLPRGRMGTYDACDFVLVLLVFAVSGVGFVSHFFKYVEPACASLTALWNRGKWAKRSTLSRFLAAMTEATCEALRTLFLPTSASMGSGPKVA